MALELVHEDGAMLTSVPEKIGLRIPGDIEPADVCRRPPLDAFRSPCGPPVHAS